MVSVEKYIGCLVGLAIGDALGSLVQRSPFKRASELIQSLERSNQWPSGLALYTIDTQRALALTESLTACRKVTPEDLCNRFVRMAEGPAHLSLGCFRQPGKSFRASLDRLKAGWSWEQSGADSPGIGAAVQSAPIGLAAKDRDDLTDATIRLSLPTHRDPRAIAAAAAVAFMIFDEVHEPHSSAMDADSRLNRAREATFETESLLDKNYSNLLTLDYAPTLHHMSTMLDEVGDCLSLKQEMALSRLADRASDLFGAPVSATAGLSLAGVASALWFALTSECCFKTAVAAAMSARGDAGSVAAIVGAVCGCIRPDTIPVSWCDSLINVDQISMRALQLAGQDIPTSLPRDLYSMERTWTERFHRKRNEHRLRLRSASVAVPEEDTVFGVRIISGRTGDPCVFFFDGNLDLCGLFDLGRTFPLRPGDVRRLGHLLVTHSHIDHFIGFDHILRHSLNRPEILHVFGPPRITNQVQHRLRSYIWNLRRSLRLDIHVHEVDDEKVTVTSLSMRTAFTRREEMESQSSKGIIFDGGRFTFRAAVLQHGMPCLGYAVEQPPSVCVDKERLDASGLRPGPWLNNLKKAWHAGTLAETQMDVHGTNYPAQRLADDLLVGRPGRKVAYVVDTAFTEETHSRIVDLARGADLFLCEAAFSHQLDLDKARRKAHLTAHQAGQMAHDAEVKRLHIFHFSRRYQADPSILIREAKNAARGIDVTY
ncbi:MAG: ADP-ribosylglycohydrolase family protein [bacterium]